MGLRPNQPYRPVPRRCRHPEPPVPVEVHDTLDGSSEVVCWLCPTCLGETWPRPPAPPAGLRTWGMGTEEALDRVRRISAPSPRTFKHPDLCTCDHCRYWGASVPAYGSQAAADERTSEP